jgi:hypothetical protein
MCVDDIIAKTRITFSFGSKWQVTEEYKDFSLKVMPTLTTATISYFLINFLKGLMINKLFLKFKLLVQANNPKNSMLIDICSIMIFHYTVRYELEYSQESIQYSCTKQLFSTPTNLYHM